MFAHFLFFAVFWEAHNGAFFSKWGNSCSACTMNLVVKRYTHAFNSEECRLILKIYYGLGRRSSGKWKFPSLSYETFDSISCRIFEGRS